MYASPIKEVAPRATAELVVRHQREGTRSFWKKIVPTTAAGAVGMAGSSFLITDRELKQLVMGAAVGLLALGVTTITVKEHSKLHKIKAIEKIAQKLWEETKGNKLFAKMVREHKFVVIHKGQMWGTNSPRWNRLMDRIVIPSTIILNSKK